MLFQASGYVKDHSELPRAPTPRQLQQQKVQVLLSAVPAQVPVPLPSCPRADAGALSTEPGHCVSIGPAMAWLGNARQDTLDAGEAGEWGV